MTPQSFPLDAMCSICGEDFGDHLAKTYACPDDRSRRFRAARWRLPDGARALRVVTPSGRRAYRRPSKSAGSIARALARTRVANAAALAETEPKLSGALAELAPELWTLREKSGP